MKKAAYCCVDVVFDSGDALTVHQFNFKRIWDSDCGAYNFRQATMESSETFDGVEYRVLINWEQVTHIREVSCGACNESRS